MRLAELPGQGAVARGEALAAAAAGRAAARPAAPGLRADVAAVVENLPVELRDEVRSRCRSICRSWPAMRQVGERQRRSATAGAGSRRAHCARRRRGARAARPRLRGDGAVAPCRRPRAAGSRATARRSAGAPRPRARQATPALGAECARSIRAPAVRPASRAASLPRGIEMAQPAEAVQLARPGGARRLDGERRAAAQMAMLPASPNWPSSISSPEARVGRAQILRHDEQLIDRGVAGTPSGRSGPASALHRSGRPLAGLVDRQRAPCASRSVQRQFRRWASPCDVACVHVVRTTPAERAKTRHGQAAHLCAIGRAGRCGGSVAADSRAA